jgi:hypothetical protein
MMWTSTGLGNCWRGYNNFSQEELKRDKPWFDEVLKIIESKKSG